MLLPVLATGAAASLLAGWWYERHARRRALLHALPGRYVDVDGLRIHLTDEGAGAPSVVILHGAGESSYSWAHVRRGLAGFTRVVSFDRPGLGASDPRPSGRPMDPVGELRRLLVAADIPGPYVLVGHSLGGLIARLFAVRHPEDIAGLVLVDSTHESLKDDAKFRFGFGMMGYVVRFFRLTSPLGLPRIAGEVLGRMPMYPERAHLAKQLPPAELERWASIVYRNFAGSGAGEEFRAVFGLLDEASRTLADSERRPQLGSLPLAVVTQPGWGEPWLRMQADLATRSSDSILRVSDQKGHNLQMPRPELVIDAIRHVVGRVRR